MYSPAPPAACTWPIRPAAAGCCLLPAACCLLLAAGPSPAVAKSKGSTFAFALPFDFCCCWLLGAAGPSPAAACCLLLAAFCPQRNLCFWLLLCFWLCNAKAKRQRKGKRSKGCCSHKQRIAKSKGSKKQRLPLLLPLRLHSQKQRLPLLPLKGYPLLLAYATQRQKEQRLCPFCICI
jgi:hypothetical protein